MYKKETLDRIVNLRKEYRAGINIIAEFALSAGAIIYGGYVRDKIIMEFNKHNYFKNDIPREELLDKYWEPEFNLDTRSRLILPKDIDICFKNTHNLKKFLHHLKQKFDIITIYNEGFENDIKYTKIRAFYDINKSFIDDDTVSLTFEIDVKISLKLEPPFNNLDFITNSIVIDNSMDNLRISKNCGIPMLDIENHFKYIVLSKIINMIHCKKSIIVKKVRSIKEAKRILIKSVEMFSDNWTISNFECFSECNNLENNCTICFENKPDLVVLNSSNIHYNCLIKYIKNTNNSINKDDSNYVFNGPYREKFEMNFKNNNTLEI